jgi:hypothetical protein
MSRPPARSTQPPSILFLAPPMNRKKEKRCKALTLCVYLLGVVLLAVLGAERTQLGGRHRAADGGRGVGRHKVRVMKKQRLETGFSLHPFQGLRNQALSRNTHIEQ